MVTRDSDGYQGQSWLLDMVMVTRHGDGYWRRLWLQLPEIVMVIIYDDGYQKWLWSLEVVIVTEDGGGTWLLKWLLEMVTRDVYGLTKMVMVTRDSEA